MKKRKDGQYYRVTFVWQGKRYERKGKTQTEAHEKAAELKAALKRGDIGVSGNMTVKAWADEWLEVYKRPIVGEKQYDMYQSYISHDILPVIGGKRLKDVKPVELQKIVNARAGQSKSSIDKITVTLKSLFERAYKSDLVPRNPAEFIERPAAKDGTHRSITPDERSAILAVAETHRAGLWIKTLLYCGLRPGETRALQWRHIDFNKKLIRVEVAMKAATREIGAPKSAAGVRNVPIPDKLIEDFKLARGTPFTPVFSRQTEGLHHTESSMRAMWNSFKRDLDIYMGARLYRNKILVHVVSTDLEPYCLRHTFCTDLQDKGVPINIARYLMGHSDISMTSKIYTHTTEAAIQSAAELINKDA